MGWLTKFFRGSTHNISEGQYHSRPAEETSWNEPSSSHVVTVRTLFNMIPSYTTLFIFGQYRLLESLSTS